MHAEITKTVCIFFFSFFIDQYSMELELVYFVRIRGRASLSDIAEELSSSELKEGDGDWPVPRKGDEVFICESTALRKVT